MKLKSLQEQQKEIVWAFQAPQYGPTSRQADLRVSWFVMDATNAKVHRQIFPVRVALHGELRKVDFGEVG